MFKDINKNIIFKKQHKEDEEFLFSLYSSTREDELNLTTMTQMEKKRFLREQFDAKKVDYAKKFKDAEFLTIFKKKKPIGSVVFQINDSVHLVEIAFVKKSRNCGYGSEIIRSMLKHADDLNKKFHLSVSVDNIRAIRLYKKLGLEIIDQQNNYLNMQNKNF